MWTQYNLGNRGPPMKNTLDSPRAVKDMPTPLLQWSCRYGYNIQRMTVCGPTGDDKMETKYVCFPQIIQTGNGLSSVPAQNSHCSLYLHQMFSVILFLE